jgi:hypothetical protein
VWNHIHTSCYSEEEIEEHKWKKNCRRNERGLSGFSRTLLTERLAHDILGVYPRGIFSTSLVNGVGWTWTTITSFLIQRVTPFTYNV